MLKAVLNNHPLLKGIAATLFGKAYPIFLDYPIRPEPRYGYGKPPHPKLYSIIDRNRIAYGNYLNRFLKFKDYFTKIPGSQDSSRSTKPAWVNGWLPGLDAVALYGFLSLNDPKRYFEIGSGNSTKFARQAIIDQKLRTKITSFDPQPRAEIDSICDHVVRQPVEDADPRIFSKLKAGDILFVDNSHRVFTNSDATVVFLDIVPYLQKGVLVEFHDVTLPFDYPPQWSHRYYSEQYLLAAYLLAEGSKFETILPNAFISRDAELSKIMNPLWADQRMKGVETHGGSFWIKIK